MLRMAVRVVRALARRGELRRPLVFLSLATGLSLIAAGQAAAATFTNPATITINDGADSCNNGEPAPNPGIASPYPSTIAVSGLTGVVSDVNVTLNGLTHTFTDDVDVLLVGPGGQRTIVMADVGGNGDATNFTLAFDDSAANALPDDSPFSAGTYKPTLGTVFVPNESCAVPTSFPAPAPAGPYGAPSLAVFNGTDPNGTWSLYVVDDSVVDNGFINSGWTLDITTGPLAVTLTSLSAVRSQKGVLVRWHTGTEVHELGFNLYRQVGSRRVRVNRRLLPAIGGVTGASYSFRDRRAPQHRALRYWLQDVDIAGARTWHGPVRVTAS